MNSLDLQNVSPVADDEEFYLPAEHHRPGIVAQEVLRNDPSPNPKVLLDAPPASLGTGPIPAARYFSREYAELERARLWPKVWQYACWSYDIPEPGDIHVYRILDRSVLLVRQRDMSIRAFINACLHRGRELCESHTSQAELRCPYHAFTWRLDGELKWTPSKWDFPQVDEANFRLPQLRCELWNGMVFVNFDDTAEPLLDFLGGIVGQWAESGWDFNKRFKAVHVRKRINVNWKTGQDAFIEAFHSFSSHPQFISTVPDDCTQVDVFPGEPNFNRMITVVGIPSTRLDPQPSPDEVFETMADAFLPGVLQTEDGAIKPGETVREAVARVARLAYARNLGIDASKLTISEAIDPVSYSVFPNLAPWPTLYFPLTYHFIPLDDEWCYWDTIMFLPFVGERPPSAPMIELGPDDSFETVASLGKMGLVAQQDGDQLPAVQRGMRNLKSGLITLTEYQEQRIRHFHRTYEKYLGI
jgi:nitrite reductase/ring-hydroxylating ferredoxin subunit